MQLKSLSKKIIVYILFSAFILMESRNIHTAYAANLRFYNNSANAYENYTGKQVIYQLNGREVPLSYPGILINGTALADYEELFVNELGLQAKLSGDVLTLTDGTTELIMVFGGTNVRLNGKYATMSVAPVKLTFENTEKYYIPTRYVAEAFGFDYVWNSSTRTVKITRIIPLTIDNTEISYNGTLYSFYYQNERFYTDMPIIYYKGSVLAPVMQFSQLLGCSYEENGKTLQITKNQLTLSVPTDSKTTYINNKKIITDSLPVKVTDNMLEKSEWYISLEFIADMLGFDFSYSESEKCYFLTENDLTGKKQLHSGIFDTTGDNNNTEFNLSAQEIYFDWYSDVVSETPAEHTQLTRVLGYATEAGDVVELYGISKDNIIAFRDNNGLMVLELNNVYTDIQTEFFSHFGASCIDYLLLSAITNTNVKLFFMLSSEDFWHMTEAENCIRILIEEEQNNFGFLSGSSSGSHYPDDKLIIPLKESMPEEFVSMEDNYINREFTIKILGNYVNFYEQSSILNPYYGVKSYDVTYDSKNFQTILTFKTNSIRAANYTVENDYIEVTVGKPNEIYDKIVVLDAGHGGIDPGATKSGYNEKDINFKIINTYTKELFENSEVKVYYTRETDTKIDLYERAAFADEVGADLFISLHLNSNNKSSINGTEVYYYKGNTAVSKDGITSQQLAKALVNNLSSALGTKNRGVLTAEFVVVKYNTVPAVLIELGYMTNASDLAKITSATYQKKTAETIYQTVLSVLK